jgi:RNA recognition motif-containing protein
MNIYVGNLAFSTTEDDLREAFAAHGEVTSVNIIKDRHTGDSRGFGFVEMADEQAGTAAIDALNNVDLGGRTLKVNQARPKRERAW